MPPGKRPDSGQFEAAARNPQHYLDRRPFKLKTRAEHELAMFALGKLGQSLPAVAATRFEKIQSQFFGEEQAYVWAQLGMAGAMKHRPEALDWFARAGDRLSDRQLHWKTRAAMRQQKWAAVRGFSGCDVRQGKAGTGVALLEGARPDRHRARG